MAKATFRHNGAMIDHTPVADLAAGDVVVQGGLVGVAARDIKANANGSLAVEGIFDFAKGVGPGSAQTVGADAYWDGVSKQATADPAAGANKRIGRVVKAAADNDTTVRIRMSQ